MATRDRTADFLKLRNARGRNEAAQRLLHEAEARVPVAPVWLEQMNEVKQLAQRIQMVMTELDQKQRQHLRVEFSVNRDEESEQAEINRLLEVIDSLFRRTEGLIRDLDDAYKDQLEDDGGSDSELRILRNVKMYLVGEIAQLSKAHRDAQRRYMNEVTKQKRVTGAWGGLHSQALEEQLERDAKMEGYLAKGMTQDQIEQIMLNTDMVNERTKEFEKIMHSMKSLHEMFKDMNVLIAEQGTVLDRVDYNMTLTVERSRKATEELKAAAKMQKAGTFKLCVLFLIVLIIGFLLALFFKAVS